MEDVKPPAPPASADTSAPAAALAPTVEPPASADTSAPAAALAPTVERAKAPPIERVRPAVYETLSGHLLEANGPATEGTHARVQQHAELRGLHPVMEFDGANNEFVMRPHWKVRVLLAWWKAHGLEHHSRISPQHFEAALHEALNGRV